MHYVIGEFEPRSVAQRGFPSNRIGETWRCTEAKSPLLAAKRSRGRKHRLGRAHESSWPTCNGDVDVDVVGIAPLHRRHLTERSIAGTGVLALALQSPNVIPMYDVTDRAYHALRSSHNTRNAFEKHAKIDTARLQRSGIYVTFSNRSRAREETIQGFAGRWTLHNRSNFSRAWRTWRSSCAQIPHLIHFIDMFWSLDIS